MSIATDNREESPEIGCVMDLPRVLGATPGTMTPDDQENPLDSKSQCPEYHITTIPNDAAFTW